jgi:hypothetical protein
MAIKVTDLTEKTTLANNDVLLVEDIAASATKKVTRTNLFKDAPINNDSQNGSILEDFTVPDTKMAAPTAFSASRSTNQSISAGGVTTVLQLSTENYDYGSNYNTGTYRFVAPVKGIYNICVRATHATYAGLNGELISVGFRVNGSAAYASSQNAGGDNSHSLTISLDVYLEPTHYVEAYATQGSGSARNLSTAVMTGHLVRELA